MRLARRADLPALRAIYADSVSVLAPACYSADQVHAWAAFAQDGAFHDFILDVATWVVIDAVEGVPLGFCGIGDDGHVASLYVAPAHGRRGIGASLLRHALNQCPRPSSGRWFAEASRLSRPVFERIGFRLVAIERTQRDGVAFERERVERLLN
jgi:putative acetyltransferase